MSGLLIILTLLLPLQGKPEYPLNNGRPTSKGIDLYVEENAEALIREFQAFIGDTLYNANLYTENLSENNDQNPLELGNYYPNEIFINNAEIFIAYELDALPGSNRDTILSSNLFVKAAVFHELMHHYIYQISIEMLRQDQIYVDRAYQSFFRIYSHREDPGPRFIEEGICEYVTRKMKQTISRKRPYIPKKIPDLNKPENEYHVFYKYSAYYLTEFLDETGLKPGIKILLHNRPPSAEEILEPELFFTRLKAIE
ncbi:MAG: hypothetical protein P1P86_10250 [Bacteroidales bacterium]|nr:hypothetical protein [Bacteroidales bacterium]